MIRLEDVVRAAERAAQYDDVSGAPCERLERVSNWEDVVFAVAEAMLDGVEKHGAKQMHALLHDYRAWRAAQPRPLTPEEQRDRMMAVYDKLDGWSSS